MDNKTAMYWVAIIQQAKRGSKQAVKLLKQEDQAREELNLPTLMEDLEKKADKVNEGNWLLLED